MEELPENIADAPEIDLPSAQEPAPKKVIGRPITKENCREYQLSAARAKRLRKEARAKMLEALTTRLDMGDELYKAMSRSDEKYLNMIEKALRIVGLHHDQSQEAVAQKLEVSAQANVKTNGKLEVEVKGL